MTYCVGFKSSNAVFLISDSVISVKSTNDFIVTNEPHTTFGEINIAKDYLLEDQLSKVFKLPKNVIVTFSGQLDLAIEAINILKNNIEYENNILDAIHKLEFSGPFPRIELLIGFVIEETPYLYSYNHENNQKMKEESSIIHLGSGRANNLLITKCSHVVDLLRNTEKSNARLFIYIQAFLQNFLIKNPLLEFGVGGYINGAFADSSGIYKNFNTTYILYASVEKKGIKNLHLNYHISIRQEEDFLIISSSFLNEDRVCYQKLEQIQKCDEADVHKTIKRLQKEIYEKKPTFVIFLNQLNYGFTVVYLENDLKPPEIEINHNNIEGNVKYRLSSKLIKSLLHPYQLQKDEIDPDWDRNDPNHIEIPIRWFS